MARKNERKAIELAEICLTGPIPFFGGYKIGNVKVEVLECHCKKVHPLAKERYYFANVIAKQRNREVLHVSRGPLQHNLVNWNVHVYSPGKWENTIENLFLRSKRDSIRDAIKKYKSSRE